MYKISLAALSLSLFLISGIAQAGTIGNGPPNQSGGSDLNSFLEADDFVVSSATAQITQITFWALQSSPSDFTGSVDWAFYSDLSGSPNAPVVSGNSTPTGIATGNSTFGLDEYSYSFNVNTTLSLGTYWLVLHNGPTATLPSTSFYWAWSNGDTGNSMNLDLSLGGTSSVSLDAPSTPWVGNFSELAFQLTTANAPEPVSMALAGSGILAAWLLRKAKGKKG